MGKVFKNFERGWTQTPNEILNDKNLSLGAKGLWTYIASKPDGWEFSINGTVQQNTNGRDSIRTHVEELESFQLLIRKGQGRKEKGKFSGGDWELHDRVGFSDDGEPDNGKSVTSKTLLSKTLQDVFISKEILTYLVKNEAKIIPLIGKPNYKLLASHLSKKDGTVAEAKLAAKYMKHKKELQKKVTPSMLKALDKDVKIHGIEKVQECLQTAMEKGWISMFYDGKPRTKAQDRGESINRSNQITPESWAEHNKKIGAVNE